MQLLQMIEQLKATNPEMVEPLMAALAGGEGAPAGDGNTAGEDVVEGEPSAADDAAEMSDALDESGVEPEEVEEAVDSKTDDEAVKKEASELMNSVRSYRRDVRLGKIAHVKKASTSKRKEMVAWVKQVMGR
jgi:hypothetical protein